MFDPLWDKLFSRDEYSGASQYPYPNEIMTFFVARAFSHVADRKKVRILDLGCGRGPTTWFLAREGYSVSAIDGSWNALSITRKRLLKEDLQADFIQGDIKSLPYRDQSFDAVIDIMTSYTNHPDDIVKTYREIGRVLVPGGHVCSVFPADGSDQAMFQGTGPFLLFSIDEVKAVFALLATRLAVEHQINKCIHSNRERNYWLAQAVK